jgi:glycosyltransferase involved in cell wall biosynthesis
LSFLIDDGFPTFRPDVTALFGTYLFRLGLRSDLVTRASGGEAEWPAGRLSLSPPHASRIKSHLVEFLHDLKFLFRLKKTETSAIQVRDKPLISPFALLKARLLGVPFFYWMSYPMSESAIRMARDPERSLGLLRRCYLGGKGYGGLIVLRGLVFRAAAHGVPLSRMTAVPMGVDLDRFATPPAAASDDRLRGRRVIAYLGTCERVRRIDFLFEVVAHLARSYPDITLLLIGDAIEDDDKAWLRRRIAEIGVADHVVITGWLPQSAAQSYLASAEVALALMAPDPLLDSTTPTKLVEYLAMGKPVVANDHPDQRKVIEDSGAGVCTAFDPAQFAQGVSQILSMRDAPATMGLRGKAYVANNRSYAIIASRLYQIYCTFLPAQSS